MKLIQFIISMLLTVCTLIMLCGAITRPCIMKEMNIGITLLLVTGCMTLNKLTYKEFKTKTE